MGLTVVSFVQTTGFSVGTGASPAQTHVALNGLILDLLYDATTSPTVSSVTNTAGDTWTQIPANSPYTPNPGHSVSHAIYYVPSTIGAVNDVITVVMSGAVLLALGVTEVSGQNVAAFYKTSNVGTGSSTAIATASLTLTGNAIIVATMFTNGGPASAGSGYTLANEDGGANLGFDEYHITGTSEAATATATSSAYFSILAAAFSEADAARRRTLLGVGL